MMMFGHAVRTRPLPAPLRAMHRAPRRCCNGSKRAGYRSASRRCYKRATRRAIAIRCRCHRPPFCKAADRCPGSIEVILEQARDRAADLDPRHPARRSSLPAVRRRSLHLPVLHPAGHADRGGRIARRRCPAGRRRSWRADLGDQEFLGPAQDRQRRQRARCREGAGGGQGRSRRDPRRCRQFLAGAESWR